MLTHELTSIPSYARKDEGLGYDCLWSSETKHDPFLPLAVAATVTSQLKLGTAIAVAFPRSPMVLAHLAWDLQRASGGRFVLGLGTQVKGHNERRFSVRFESPGPKMREIVLALRAIWDCWQNGTRLDFKGRFYRFDLMTPFFNPGPIEHPRIPVYVAGVNQYMCRIAGEVCDGLHVHPFNSPKYLREYVQPAVNDGLHATGRKREDFVYATSTFVVVGDTEEELAQHRRSVKAQIAFYASTRTYEPVLAAHGWQGLTPTLHRKSVEGDWTRMHAYVVRQNRFGPPREAWRREIIPTPTLGPDEVLVYVMASGINYNNVWAALGAPLDVIGERQKAGEPEDFHAGGSDCSGIVWAVGRDVKNARVGDEVVVHSGWWRPDDPWVRSGRDPMLAESTRIRGYQTNYGSYGQLDRGQFSHWGPLPDTKDARAYGEWAKGARAFGKALWDALGDRVGPRIVFEHPGEATLPTSVFVCATGGMVVICAGTTGYNATLDLRYLWMRQKRFQGSHLSNDAQAAAVTRLVADGHVDPCLSKTYAFDDIPECHQLMLENKHPYGNMAVLVNARTSGQGAST